MVKTMTGGWYNERASENIISVKYYSRNSEMETMNN